MKGLDKKKHGANKGKKFPKRNVNIPSVFEVFGEPLANRNGDLPQNILFLPTQEKIEQPIAIDTSKMARAWARGKL